MNESENKKILGVVIESSKLTAEAFKKAIDEVLNNMQSNKTEGKTTISKLKKQGKVDSIEVSDKNIGSFNKIAKKHNLTFAIKRTKGENDKNQYLVCFNAKNLDTMQKAFKEYAHSQSRKKETLFSKKKVANIDISTNRDTDLGKEKQKERKKERSERER